MAANIANRRKTYIKQPGLMRKTPKRFCILTNVLIGAVVVERIVKIPFYDYN